MKSQATRVLVTGSNGFVGRHLGATLRARFGGKATLLGTSLHSSCDPNFGQIIAVDVTDERHVTEVIRKFEPTHIVHLAGIAAVRAAVADPATAWNVHLFGTLNIARAALTSASDCVVLWTGSGQAYGASANSGRSLDENSLLAPQNEYELTKAAADLALGAMAAQGLKCVRFRPFNHIGPGQTEDFAVPAFAMQVARIALGRQPPILTVGNLDAERDFLDVRDVTEAYAAAIKRSEALSPGIVINVSSGVPRRMQDVLDALIAFAGVKLTIKQDPTRMRPSDISRLVGDASRARKLLHWAPTRTFEKTLADVYNDCLARAQG